MNDNTMRNKMKMLKLIESIQHKAKISKQTTHFRVTNKWFQIENRLEVHFFVNLLTRIERAEALQMDCQDIGSLINCKPFLCYNFLPAAFTLVLLLTPV